MEWKAKTPIYNSLSCICDVLLIGICQGRTWTQGKMSHWHQEGAFAATVFSI